ncbi:hypothetical protein EIP91_001643 [Steccherinum ochraceum]|uniref:Uncharacterized protein n=1 Tax=Steccherinum ochraceum TaxID=92696 RepID=A0A4R0RDM3_9APHY|nr:hypothetical protein EIP91_001643 [Steccherinum ochraceum]
MPGRLHIDPTAYINAHALLSMLSTATTTPCDVSVMKTQAAKGRQAPLSTRTHARSKEPSPYELDFDGPSCSPLAMLPADVLIEIFLWTQAHMVPTPEAAKQWMSYTHVCRYWRTTALECRLLWCHIYGELPRDLEFVQEMIARSGETPLRCLLLPPYFYDVDPATSGDKMVARLLPVMHRVEELSVTWCHSLGTVDIPDIPLLRSLKMKQRHGLSDETQPLGAAGAPLARLETITFHGLMSASVYAFMRPSLKHLRIGGCMDATVAELLLALRGTLMLESLILEQSNIGLFSDSELPTFSLPSLKHFRMEYIPGKCAAQLLHHIQLSADVRIDVLICCENSAPQSRWRLMDVIAAKLAGDGILEPRKPVSYIAMDRFQAAGCYPIICASLFHVEWNANSDQWVEFTDAQTREGLSGPFCRYVCCDAHFANARTAPDVASALDYICRMAAHGLEDVRTLSFKDTFLNSHSPEERSLPYDSPPAWYESFGRMTGLETLHLRGFMWQELGAVYHASVNPIPFPRLRCLHLEYVQFRNPYVRLAQWEGDLHIEDLLAVVRTRDEAGMRLSRLVFSHGVSGLEVSEDLPRLASYVDEVEIWD